MLKLDEVLTGVQSAEQRQAPQIPPALSQVAFGETVIDSRLATPGSLFVALSGSACASHDVHGAQPDASATSALDTAHRRVSLG